MIVLDMAQVDILHLHSKADKGVCHINQRMCSQSTPRSKLVGTAGDRRRYGDHAPHSCTVTREQYLPQDSSYSAYSSHTSPCYRFVFVAVPVSLAGERWPHLNVGV